MTKKTIIQIDGGFLRAVVRYTAGGRRYDNDFIEQFAKAIITPDEDLLRVLYYDSPRYSGKKQRPVSKKIEQFTDDSTWLNELAARPYFAVRRGTIKWRGWKLKNAEQLKGPPQDSDYAPDFQQKGVDLRVGLDIATFAYEQTVDRIILVSADTDFVPAMKLARRRGLQVVGVEIAGQELSSEFRQHIDFSKSIDIRSIGVARPVQVHAVARGSSGTA